MKKKNIFVLVVLVLSFVALNINYVWAEESSEVNINWIYGPQNVDIGTDLAKFDIPENYVFANGDDAKKIMEEMGNFPTDKEQGIVFPNDETQNWYVIFEYDEVGYVKDDEAESIDAEQLISDITNATAEANEERKSQGISELNVVGWDEKPHYDEISHNLVWSIIGESDGERIVNYNIRLLGREGFTSVTLVSGEDELDSIKLELDKIINNFTYIDGKKYTDYIPGKDKISEFGLTALIAGGVGAAAAKTGLLATIILIIKKIWIIVIVVIGGFIKKLFGRSKKKTVEEYNQSQYTEDEVANIEENEAIDCPSENTNKLSD